MEEELLKGLRIKFSSKSVSDSDLPNDLSTLSKQSKIKLLHTIAGNRNINDDLAVRLFRRLDLQSGDDIDCVNTKFDYPPLFLAWVTAKLGLFYELLGIGASPFTKLTNDSPISYSKSRAATVFSYILEIYGLENAATYFESFYFKDKFYKIERLEDIIALPIQELSKGGLFLEKHKTYICNILLKAIDKLNIDQEYKIQLRNFLLEPELLVPNFQKIDRIHVVAELIDHLQNPYSQSQNDTDFCGPNTFFMVIARRAPNVFVHITMSLLDKQQVKFPINIVANSTISNTIEDLSALLCSSLKSTHSRSSVLFLNNATPPSELQRWLEAIGCMDIKDLTKCADSYPAVVRPMASWLVGGLHKNGMIANIDYTEDLRNSIAASSENKDLIMLCDYDFINKITPQVFDMVDYHFVSDPMSRVEQALALVGVKHRQHWVVLKEIKFGENNTVDMKIYTFGMAMSFNIKIDELRKYWLGVMQFTLPEKLVLTRAELNRAEAEMSPGRRNH